MTRNQKKQESAQKTVKMIVNQMDEVSSRMISSSELPQESPEEPEVKNVPDKSGKAENALKTSPERRITNKGKKKDDTKVFSFRSWIDEVDDWRLYAAVKGIQIDELGAAALKEYMEHHPLTKEEQTVKGLMLRIKKQKS